MHTNPPSSLVRLERDSNPDIAWVQMVHDKIPCFSVPLLSALNRLGANFVREDAPPPYVVLTAGASDVFSLGGDLALFTLLVRDRDVAGLRAYAKMCLQGTQWAPKALLGQSVVTLALIRGHALGGGLEVALSCPIVVAERGARMGFPEISFNMFPGMGAYPYVVRRAGWRVADDMIRSGAIYQAEELAEWGLVDLVVEPGEGEAAVREHIRRLERSRNGHLAALIARERSTAVQSPLLESTIEEWVQAALRLSDRDLRVVSRLVQAQLKYQGVALSWSELLEHKRAERAQWLPGKAAPVGQDRPQARMNVFQSLRKRLSRKPKVAVDAPTALGTD